MKTNENIILKYSTLDRLVYNNVDGLTRRNLVKQLKAEGAPHPSSTVGEVITDFRHQLTKGGVVIVGSTAFEAYCSMHGLIGLPLSMTATSDVDVACITPKASSNAPRMLKSNGPTKIHRNASIDFLTPGFATPTDVATGAKIDDAEGRGKHLAWCARLGHFAHVMPADYRLLIEQPVRAVLLHDDGIPVMVPNPARFAFHKLALSESRRNPQKADKDRDQAYALLKTLLKKPTNTVAAIAQEFRAYGNGALTRPIQAALDKCPPLDFGAKGLFGTAEPSAPRLQAGNAAPHPAAKP